MAITRCPNGLALGGEPVAGESDNKLYVYDSSGTLIGTMTISKDVTIAGTVNIAGNLDITSGKTVDINENLTVSGTTNIVGSLDIASSKTVDINDNLTVNNPMTLAKQSALTAALTTITHTDPSSPDYAIQDLTTTTPYGFVTADEGQTVLKVIANLQTRMNELEAKLQTIGLLT